MTGRPGSEHSLPPSYRVQHRTNTTTTDTTTTTTPTHIRSNRPAPAPPHAVTVNNGDGSTIVAGNTTNNAIEHELTLSRVSLDITMASTDDHQQEIQRNLNRIESSTDSSGQPQYYQQQHHFHHNADVANNSKISQICELDNNVSASPTVELHRNIDRYFRKSVSDSSISDDGGSGRKDLVTIVTISGCTETESTTGEMDILAHL